jgi:type II secretory pathway component PulK
MKALYLATAGIAKCQDVLSKDKNGYDSLYYCGIISPKEDGLRFVPQSVFKDAGFRDGAFTIAYKNENGVTVFGMADEERKININKADRKTLMNIFKDGDIADAVMDWRGASQDTKDAPDKDAYYNHLENPYKRKNGDFTVTEELLLIKGMTTEVFNSVKRYVTVFGDGKVNINTASKKVLLALGVTAAAVEAIVIYRNGPDGLSGTYDDRVFTDVNIESRLRDIEPKDAASIGNLKNSFTVRSNYFKLESKGMVTNSKVARTVVAILQRDDKCGGKLIQYRE